MVLIKKPGGSREGAGRPPTVRGRKRTVYLSDAEWEYLVGVSPNHTASGGIRELIEWDTRHTYDEIKKQGVRPRSRVRVKGENIMYKYTCKNGHLKSFSSHVIVPISCDECGSFMTISESIGFTPYWYRCPSTGEIQPEPETPKGFVAVPYRDEGYYGGEYWAILPSDWTMESAIAMFEAEGHLTSLSQVNFQDVPNE